MRIIHLINHCRFANGNVHAAVDLACAQLKSGEEVWVASGHGEFVELLTQVGVSHILLDQQKRNLFATIKMVHKLIKLRNDIKPDIFHAHMMTGAIIGFLASRFSATKLVTTVHNAFDKHSLIMALGDRIIAVSAAVSSLLRSRGIPAWKIRVVLNGTVGAARRDFFPKHPIRLERPSITTICGLHDRKGLLDLLTAFSIVCEDDGMANLYIAGEGPRREAYEAFANATLPRRRIHFLGAIHDTKSLLGESDIFVLASHAEPFGLVITEAREAGCAIIATNVDGIPEALEFGTAGILVPARSPLSMAEALLNLLQDAENLSKAKSAAKIKSDNWNVDRVARDIRKVYDELLRTM